MKKKLKEICEVKQSKTTSLDDDKVWILNLDKIESHTGKILEYEYSKRTELGQSICQFDENTVLYSKLRPYLNKVVLPTGKGFATSELVPLVPKENITRKYLAAFLRSNHFVSLITDKVAGTKMPRVVMKDFFEVEIPVPTLSEQQKIAGELDTIQSAIDNKKQQLALLDEAVKSKFVEMFGENPIESGKWKIDNLGNVADIKIGPFGSLLHKQDYIENGHCLVNPSHIRDGNIQVDYSLSVNDEKYKELKPYQLEVNDIVLGRRGEMGRCAIVIDKGLLCGTGSMIIRPNGKLKSFFLNFVLSSNVTKKYLEDNAIGVTMKNINEPLVKSISVPVIPLDLQNTFAQFVQQIDKSKSLVKEQMADLQELLDSKMQEYFGRENNL